MGINSRTNETVRIGIVDTGISSINYSMIGGNILGGHNFSLDGTGRNYIKSETYHGFAVASIILKGAPKAKLVIAKVLNDEGEGTPKRTAKGIRYCISKKCHIINCSSNIATNDISDIQKYLFFSLALISNFTIFLLTL